MQTLKAEQVLPQFDLVNERVNSKFNKRQTNPKWTRAKIQTQRQKIEGPQNIGRNMQDELKGQRETHRLSYRRRVTQVGWINEGTAVKGKIKDGKHEVRYMRKGLQNTTGNPDQELTFITQEVNAEK